MQPSVQNPLTRVRNSWFENSRVRNLVSEEEIVVGKINGESDTKGIWDGADRKQTNKDRCDLASPLRAERKQVSASQQDPVDIESLNLVETH